MSVLTDALGTEFEPKVYNRIISTVPSITETLFDFGLIDRVVGVTRYCKYPEEAQSEPRRIIGGTKSLQTQKIIDLKPDLIIANKEENERERIISLQDEGVNVFVTFPQSVQDGLTMMKDFYTLLQIDDLSIYDNYIRSTEDLISSVKKRVSLSITKPRIFCPIWKDPWMSINKDTFIHSVIELCGGINVFEDHVDRYPTVSIDEIKEQRPDLILLPDEPYIFSNEHVVELKNELNIPNVTYELINGSYLSWYGTRMIKGISQLSKIIDNL